MIVSPNSMDRIAAELMGGKLPSAPISEIDRGVQWIVDALGARDKRVQAAQLRQAADALNSKGKLYQHTVRLGEAWGALRKFDAVIDKHHAQALVNLSALDEAQALLERGLAKIRKAGGESEASDEQFEYGGILARVYKQRFVLTGDKNALRQATRAYQEQARCAPEDESGWPAINAVALLMRQQRMGMLDRANATASALAQDVSAAMARRYTIQPDNPWVAATMSEAMLALDKLDLAELWLYRFLNHPRVTPFALDSYDRQLREIWQGSAAGGGYPPADVLVGVMARYLMRSQSRLSVSGSEVHDMAEQIHRDPDTFEKNFSNERGFGIGTLKSMLAKCESIGCVSNRAGERRGTGFLVDGAALNLEAGPVFVTNAHVISSEVLNATRPEDARVTFETDTSSESPVAPYAVDKILFTSRPGRLGISSDADKLLDVTVVTLRGLPSARACLQLAEKLPSIEPNTRVYVVGHPRGGGLQFSLNDSVLLDIDEPRRLVHYRTPTEPGSSGSPVFNAAWEVIALHHAGSTTAPRLHGRGNYEANEGISLGAIRDALKEFAP